MHSKTSLVVALITIALVAPAPGHANGPATVFEGATVLDGTGGPPLLDAIVIVVGDGISAVGARADLPIPDGARRVDVRGKWIVPGLVDGHVHFFQSGGLYTRPDIVDLRAVRAYTAEIEAIRAGMDTLFARNLASGVTSVMDVGGPFWNFDVRQLARAMARAPRVGVAGPLVSTVARKQLDLGDPPIVRVESEDQARALVRRQLEKKPDLVKIWYIVRKGQPIAANLPIARAAIDEAHAAGVRVAVHATQLEAARAVVEAGADVLVHSVDDAPVDAAFIAALKERGVIYTPTLIVYEGYAEVLSGKPALTDVERALGDPVVIGSWAELAGAPPGAVDPEKNRRRVERMRTRLPTMKSNLLALHRAGVIVAAGTDAGNIGTLHGPSIHRELELMVEAGMSPAAVLVSATRDAAQLFGPKPGFGTIAAGQHADLLVLDADPHADIRNLRRIHRVVRSGIVLDPAGLVPPTPETVVQGQLDAYNARDVDRFAAFFAPDVQVKTLAGKTLLVGRAALRERYTAMFAISPELDCQILTRTVSGDYVIDHEFVRGIRGGPPVRAVAIYHVEGGLIRAVWFTPKEGKKPSR